MEPLLIELSPHADCVTAAGEPRRRHRPRGRRDGFDEVTAWRRRASQFALQALWARGAEELSGFGLRKAHVVVHLLQRRLGRAARLLGSDCEQPLQLALVRTYCLVALADRRQQLDDRLADGE